MREINKNPNNLNFSGVQKFDQQKENQTPAVDPATGEQQSPLELQDLSQMPAAVTGRSLVFKGNPTDKDIQFMMKNPAFCGKANEFFDIAESKYGYENASKMMDSFVNEFQK